MTARQEVKPDALEAAPASWFRLVSQVRDSIGPLNQCPEGHLIMAASTGPSVEFMVYRQCTSAGSPHRAAPSLSM